MRVNGVDIANSRLTHALIAMLALLWSAVMMLGGFAWGSSSAQAAMRDMAVQHQIMNTEFAQFGQRIDRIDSRLNRLEQRFDVRDER